ncbi:MAG: AmmeMemoRadiSam system protein B [Candidatus Lokiarchaeota archaeon]|nr:AmmeMemoRadiSam system protein B [Candidatus Lokiarchaeota archaeon]
MNIRRMVNAGSWYPRNENDLVQMLQEFMKDKEFGPGKELKTKGLPERKIIGGVSPHAGMYYSGACAICTYLTLFEEKIPDTVIVIGFDHRNYFPDCLLEEGEWETPLGNLKVDSELAKSILDDCKSLVAKSSAFIGSSENSLELQMPIIKYFAGDNDVKIVPIKISSHEYPVLEKIANELTALIQKVNKDIVIVASSDLYHEHVYNEQELLKFKKKDENVINNFIKLRAHDIFDLGMRATVCGRHTITLVLLIGTKLGAKEGNCLKHYTSIERTKEFGYCVGYFSGVITKL